MRRWFLGLFAVMVVAGALVAPRFGRRDADRQPR